jgi:putative lysine transport system ATP-binding protein
MSAWFSSSSIVQQHECARQLLVGQIRVLGRKPDEARQKALAYLEKVGMAQFMNAKPRQLSGGQKQRLPLPVPWPWSRKSAL